MADDLRPFPHRHDTFTRSPQTPPEHTVSVMEQRAHLVSVPTGEPIIREATITVVVADDHALMRRNLRMLLEAEQDIHVTAEADHLALVEQHVRGHRPDVLVLDLTMPSGSSLETIVNLRDHNPETRIVVVSVEDTPGFAQRALAAGANAYVLKDLAVEDLPAAVRAAARGEEYLSGPIASRLAALRHTLARGELSLRETEVLRLIALGHTSVEIASQLGLSPRTIETHRARIHRKLNLRTRAELVRYALRCGLLTA
jgi:two-component system response regulator NreC